MSDDTVVKQTKNPIPNSKPFVKGDKRINRNGRPRSFDALRKLAQQIAGEEDGDYTVIYDMLKKMAKSRNPADKKTFLEYAYGKVKDEVDVTSGGDKITAIRVIWDEKDGSTDTPSKTP